MGFAYNNPQIKVDQELEPEVKKSNDPLDQSYIELEEFPDAFLDSLLDFDGWVEDNPTPSMADVLEEKPNLEILEKSLKIKKERGKEAPLMAADVVEKKPNLDKSLEKEEEQGCGSLMAADAVYSSEERSNSEKFDRALEMVKVKGEEGFGCVKLGDLGSLIEEEMSRVSLTPGANDAEIMAGDVKQIGQNGDVERDEVEVVEKGAKNDLEERVEDGVVLGGNDEKDVMCDEVEVVETGAKNEMEKRVEDGVVLDGEDEKGDVNGVKQIGQNGVVSSVEVEGVENGGKKDKDTERGREDGDVLGVIESEEETEKESDESSSSSAASSASSSSDDDDDDDYNDKGDVEMEEGEIRDVDVDEMIGWDDDEDGNVVKGPIRSKNEVQNLPPVPPVNATIEPHHQTLPVGVVLSIIGAQVIVEGVEKHNPLSEGSILWITESRSPLGVVDEIFGPVKNPYYMVRYNSESEVPAGIQQGSLISFVPEFADYVLNNNNLYKKGYDASGENDEELSDELEFSDDEKEAEYKRMLKMSKRGSSNEQKKGNMKKGKKSTNRGGNWKNDHRPSPTPQANGPSGGPTSGTVMSPAFSPRPQALNFTGPPSSGAWTNGFPSIQQQNTGFPPNGFPSIQPQNTGFPPNGFPSVQPQNMGFLSNGFPSFTPQNFTPRPFPNLALPNPATPFRPQLNATSQMMPLNFVLQGVPPNLGVGPVFASWPASMPQNGFGQAQVGPQMAFQGLLSAPSMNALPQGLVMPNGLQMQNTNGMRPPMPIELQMQSNNGFQMQNNGVQMENNGGVRPPFVAGNGEASRDPNQGNGHPNRGGKRPFQRGGGRFRGGGRGGRNGQQPR